MYLNDIWEPNMYQKNSYDLTIVLDKNKHGNNYQYILNLNDKKIVRIYGAKNFELINKNKKFDRKCFEELQTYTDIHIGG